MIFRLFYRERFLPLVGASGSESRFINGINNDIDNVKTKIPSEQTYTFVIEIYIPGYETININTIIDKTRRSSVSLS